MTAFNLKSFQTSNVYTVSVGNDRFLHRCTPGCSSEVALWETGGWGMIDIGPDTVIGHVPNDCITTVVEFVEQYSGNDIGGDLYKFLT